MAEIVTYAVKPVHDLAITLLWSFSLYAVSVAFYRIYIHPLAKFPGPYAAAISNLPYCYWFLGGRQPYEMVNLHKKYGPIVRTAPNQLSFNTANSWKDIYGSRQGHRPFIKSEFYEGGSFADQYGSIVSERDPAAHGRMRKYLSSAFSQRSLSEQEGLIQAIIDEFMDRMQGFVAKDESLDITQWFNILTFDIIGDLAFGETFGGVGSGVTHPWISRIRGAMTQGALADCFQRFPLLAKFVMTVAPGPIQKAIADTKINERYAIDLVQKRIARKTNRKDFMTRILEYRDEDKIPDIQIAAHASDFVIAGSETTATALSCIVYYLCHTPRAQERVKQEIRNGFVKYQDINATTTSNLEYLNAVILEGLRIYPPLPFALPRIVPDGGDTVDGHWLPAKTVVSTNPCAACFDPKNFEEPFQFKPERWLKRNEKDILDASQPFSLGPRGCLGQSLGWMEMRSILAKFYFKYDLNLVPPDVDWQGESKMHTLWNKPVLQVRLRNRVDNES